MSVSGRPEGRRAVSLLTDLVKGDESFLVRVAFIDQKGLAEAKVSVAADRDLSLHEVSPPYAWFRASTSVKSSRLIARKREKPRRACSASAGFAGEKTWR